LRRELGRSEIIPVSMGVLNVEKTFFPIFPIFRPRFVAPSDTIQKSTTDGVRCNET
jgi:hypothetical protein